MERRGRKISFVVFFLFGMIFLLPAQKKQQKTAVSVPSTFSDKYTATDYILEGLWKMNQNQIKEASDLFLDALKIDSTNSAANFHLSQLIADPSQALPYCEKALRGDPNNIWYLIHYARILSSTQKFEQGIEVCKQILKIDYNNLEAHYLLALSYNAQENKQEALAALDVGLEIFGEEEVLLELRQEILQKSGAFEQAYQNAQRLLAIDSLSADYSLAIAQTCRLTQRDSCRLYYLTKAESIDSSNLGVLLELCDYYQEKEEQQAFFLTLEKVFKSDKMELDTKVGYLRSITRDNDFYRRYSLYIDRLIQCIHSQYPNEYMADDLYATHLAWMGKGDRALAIYKKHVLQEQPNLDAFGMVVGVERLHKNLDSVIYYHKEVMERLPENHEVPLSYAMFVFQKGDTTQAIGFLESRLKHIESDSIRSLYYGTIGDLYNETKNRKKTYHYYEKGLKADSNNMILLNNYSYSFSVDPNDKNLQRALEMSGKVIAAYPSHPTYLDTYAWILYRLGRYKEAKSHMQRAIALETNPSDVLYMHYGDILFELKETFNAKIYWEKALQKGASASEVEERMKKAGF